MSNRLTKGKALAGTFAQDQPGQVFGGIPFSAAGTTAITTSFKFSTNAVIEDVMVKITTANSTAQTISVGLCTGASSSGTSTGLVNALVIPSTGVWLQCPSTSHPTLTFTYGSYLISSTSESVTILKRWSVASTDTYQYLNYTLGSTAATAGVIYPIFYELT